MDVAHNAVGWETEPFIPIPPHLNVASRGDFDLNIILFVGISHLKEYTALVVANHKLK